jgi:hypothetical protein
MLVGFSLGSYLLLVDYTGRLFRAGKAAISGGIVVAMPEHRLADAILNRGSHPARNVPRTMSCLQMARVTRPSFLLEFGASGSV